MRTSGMGCGGGCQGCGPFYRAGEAGRQLVGGETAGGQWSFVPSVFEAETRGGKVGRRHLGGGNEEGGAPVRFGYSHVEENSRRQHRLKRRRLGRDRGRRRPGWAERPKRVGLARKYSKENGPGFKYSLGQNGNWAAENLF
jgi:hypothetical protein